MIVINNLLFRCPLLFALLLIMTVAVSCKKDVLEPQKITRIDAGIDGTLYDILFINDSVGYIAGGDRYNRSDLLTTVNGGTTWELFHFGVDAKKAVYKLSHVGEKVYAVGFDGKFITRDNPSAAWQYVQTAWWQWYESIIFTSPNHGYIAVNMGFTSGAILQVDSLGNLLKVDSFPCAISGLCFSNPGTGFACGYGTILKTMDGGLTWKIQEISGDNFKSIYCIGDNIWAAGNNGSIVHSDNGGMSWKKQRNGNDPLRKKYHLNCLFFKDPLTGYAAGEGGILLKTTDGGTHWSEFKHFTDYDLMAVNKGPGARIWVTGQGGAIFSIEE